MSYVKHVETNRTGGVDEDGYRTYTRQFLVETDNVLDGVRTVSAGVGIAHYARYDCGGSEVDLFARCKTQEVSLLSGEKYLWNYTLKYDSKPLQGVMPATATADSLEPDTTQQPSPPNNTAPEARPPLVKFAAVHRTETIYEDFTGWPLTTTAKPIRASNGEYLAGLDIEKSIAQMTISTYSIAANFYKIAKFVNRVNYATWMGFGALQLKCTDYTVEQVYEQNQWYFKRDITIQIDPDGWKTKVLDQGHYTKAPIGYSSSDSVKPVDIKGVVMNEPFLLDGSGGKLGPTANPFFLTFVAYKTEPFATIL